MAVDFGESVSERTLPSEVFVFISLSFTNKRINTTKLRDNIPDNCREKPGGVKMPLSLTGRRVLCLPFAAPCVAVMFAK